MPKKKPKKGNPEVHNELDGFNIKINEFGEITSNFEVDQLNNFLNENVEDKKLNPSKEDSIDETEEE